MKKLISLVVLIILALLIWRTCQVAGNNPLSGNSRSAASQDAQVANNAGGNGVDANTNGQAGSTTDNNADKQRAIAEMRAKQEAAKKATQAPDDVAKPANDAEKAASGLASKVLQKGSGTVNPTASDTVEVHYTGWTTDGKMFDSSIPRGKTASFPLNRVIKGWTEGVQLMVEGEKRRFWIPEDLAYGGRAGAPAGMLVFDVELIDIK